MRLVAMTAILLAACARPVPRAADGLACPPGTKPISDTDSDVGWGEVERTDGCEDGQGKLEGPAVESVSGGTLLVGRYSANRRVGTWTQRDRATGAVLGTFTLDANGTGLEIVRDREGRERRGRVVAGVRDGAWTFHEPGGKVVATDLWSAGKLVSRTGRAAWDPPMIDERDVCPSSSSSGEDGCP